MHCFHDCFDTFFTIQVLRSEGVGFIHTTSERTLSTHRARASSVERKEQHQDELAPAPLTPMVGRLAGLGRRLALDVGRLQATWQADAARTASTFAPAFGKHCYGAGPEEAGAGGETGGRDTLSSGSGSRDPSTGRLRWSGLEGLWSEGALPRSGLSGAVVGQRCYCTTTTKSGGGEEEGGEAKEEEGSGALVVEAAPAADGGGLEEETDLGDGTDLEEAADDDEADGDGEEKSMSEKLDAAADVAQAVLTPQRVCEMLDNHIVGQGDAKRSVAIALRNRWRRSRIKDADLRKEIAPKNILMIGPTGCGKTEIARRLASLADAPFVKVEATKFTEVGFHGRDVDEMVRELVESAMVLTRKRWKKIKKREVEISVERKILQSLLGGEEDDQTRKAMTQFYRDGTIEDKEVTIDVPNNKREGGFGNIFKSTMTPAIENMSDMIIKIDKVLGKDGKKPTETKTMKIGKARPLLEEMEMDKLLNADNITKEAVKIAEEEGIIFIDEIDKIVTASDARSGTEASSEGVQQDLLPIVEGSLVTTKYGQVSTNHMLFIASGAFHSVKPSDMLAELQGRLPIRVELTGLTKEDLYRILTEPQNNMVVQQRALLATEDVNLVITDEAVQEIAHVASEVNR